MYIYYVYVFYLAWYGLIIPTTFTLTISIRLCIPFNNVSSYSSASKAAKEHSDDY